MQVKPLSTVTFDTIMACFHESFEGYFVKMPKDNNYFKERWHAAKVDYDLSFGMFDNKKLVGFIINAIDYRNGNKIAYNTGTGVIPSHRGQKIVKQIYNHIIPVLKAQNIQLCTLEVITKNIGAIKAYQNVGFNIDKTYHCYNHRFDKVIDSNVRLQQIEAPDFDWTLSKNEALYSWDNQKEAILRNSGLSYYYFKSDTTTLGYAIVNKSNGYIAQIEAFSDTIEDYTMLFEALSNLNINLKINNVDARLEHKIEALNSLNFNNSIDQYEMLLKL
jgi:ribosomal protein S18 acetylase RimI-like enzyme